MFVTDTLLVFAHPFNSEQSIFLTQKSRIQLTIRHQPQEHNTHSDGQKSSEDENDFPRSDGASTLFSPFGNSVGNQAAKDLRETIEAEPDVDAEALLTFGVPLGGEESETGCDGRLEDSEKETHSNGACEVRDGREQTQSCSPHDDVERRVLAQWKSLKKSM